MEQSVISMKKHAVKKVIALASAGAVLLLAGCSSPTAAFSVGKKSTTVNEVQTSVNNIMDARKKVDTTGMNLQTGSALVEGQVQFLLISQLLADTAKSVGITVVPAEVASEKAAAIKQVGGETALPKALVGAGIDPTKVDQYFTSVIYSQKLSAYVQKAGVDKTKVGAALTEMVATIATKEGVTVNPRYGKWDPKSATLVPADASSGAVKTK
jgi:outer membrane murein-binding lipoprotein Lpp